MPIKPSTIGVGAPIASINPINLAPSGIGVGVPQQNRTEVSISYDIFLEQSDAPGAIAEAIGFLTDINDNSARPVTPIRHLSSADAGKIIELVPGVENVTLSVTGFALYAKNSASRNSIVNRLSGDYGLYCLNQNKYYFSIKKTVTHPNPPAGYKPTTGVIFRQCLLTGWRRSRSINQATQAEQADIQVSWIDSYEA